MADALHRHSELSASDGSPNPALSVDAAGNVGIGTTAPVSTLHIDGDVLIDNDTGAQPLWLTRVGRSNQSAKLWVDDASFFTQSIQDEGSGVYGNIVEVLDADGDPRWGVQTSTAVNGALLSVYKAWITKNGDGYFAGNVGIGTTSPQEMLDVAGNLAVAGDAAIGGDTLSLSNATNPIFAIADTTSNTITAIQSQDSFGLIGTTTNHPLIIATNSAAAMLLDTSGNHGIGTTSPASRLDVEANASGYAAEFLNSGSDANRKGIKIQSGDDATTCVILEGYDDTSTLIGGLQIVSGNFELFSNSDRSLKDNIRTTSMDTESIVGDIKVRDFRWISNNIDSTGFIAQEIAEVYPPAVGTVNYMAKLDTGTTKTLIVNDEMGGVVVRDVWVADEELRTHQTVMPLRLIPVLVKECQRLQEKVSALENATSVTQTVDLQNWTPNEAALNIIIDALLVELEEAPWVEIAAVDAMEFVAEMESIDTPTSVTRYHFNSETGLSEPYETTEIVTTTRATGRQIYQLKDGVRLDPVTGQFLIQQTAPEGGRVALLGLQDKDLLAALQGALKERILLAKKTPSLDQNLLDTLVVAEKRLNTLSENIETAAVEEKGE